MDGPGGSGNSARVQALVLEALKAALSGPGEDRLYRGGKLPGLFHNRYGAPGAAAAFALRERLFEVTRSEIKSKLTVEWVRITPAGVDYLHRHESPRAVLGELREALAVTRSGVPVWLDEVRQELSDLGVRLAEEVGALGRRLESLARRVDDALRRADAAGPGWPDDAADAAPWAIVALAYLDRRRECGSPAECPLPELFTAVRRREPGLNLLDFQDGLKRLAAAKGVRLTPFPGPAAEIPEPQHAIPAGTELLYFAQR
jgi:hypothetical protein